MNEIKILLVDDHFTTIMGLEVLLKSIPNLKLVGSAYDGEEALVKIEELKPDIVLLDIYMKPKLDGIKVTEIITKKYPNIKVILHTSSSEEKDIIEGFEAGALGYIPKTFKPSLLIEAINQVYNGEAYIIGDVAKAVWKNFRSGKDSEIPAGGKTHSRERTSFEDILEEANELCQQQEWSKALNKFDESYSMIPDGQDNPQRIKLANLVRLTPTELKVLAYAVKSSSKSKDIAKELDMAVKTVSTHRQNIMNKFEINDFDEIIKDMIKFKIIEG